MYTKIEDFEEKITIHESNHNSQGFTHDGMSATNELDTNDIISFNRRDPSNDQYPQATSYSN